MDPLPPLLVKNYPLSERPRERCLERGAKCLSLREILSLLIHSGPKGVGALGVARALLERPGIGLSEKEQERAVFVAFESSAENAALAGIPGLGPAARARLLAAFELGRRYAFQRENSNLTRNLFVSQPQSRLFRAASKRVSSSHRQEPREWLGFVALHRSGELGELCLVELGVRTHVNIEPAELFARLLSLRPQGFFLFHNHPSGTPEPSDADVELTENIDGLSRALGIRLLGHAVVTSAGETWIPMLT